MSAILRKLALCLVVMITILAVNTPERTEARQVNIFSNEDIFGISISKSANQRVSPARQQPARQVIKRRTYKPVVKRAYRRAPKRRYTRERRYIRRPARVSRRIPAQRKVYKKTRKRPYAKKTYRRHASNTSASWSERAVVRSKSRYISRSKVSGRSRFSSIIAKHASNYGVPVKLAHAVIQIESNYRPGIRGGAGEVGLMQIKPATARAMGFRGSVKALYNPETNIKYGMKYLAGAYKISGGTLCGTVLRYNAGHGARRMNPISARYCRKAKRILGRR